MIRIPRTELDYAIAALIACGKNARNRQGLRIRFPIAEHEAERVILGALTALYTGPGPVMPMVEYGPRGLSTEQLAERYGVRSDEPRGVACAGAVGPPGMTSEEARDAVARSGALAHGKVQGEGLQAVRGITGPVGQHGQQYSREQLAERYGLTLNQVDAIYGTRPGDSVIDATTPIIKPETEPPPPPPGHEF
jgi:hypothetical protein